MLESKCVVLYDQTSGANAALDTGIIDTRDFDSLGFMAIASGAITASSVGYYHATAPTGTSYLFRTAALTAGQTLFEGSWGPAVGLSLNNMTALTIGVPPGVRFTFTAAGADVTMHVMVWGRRNSRGPAVSMAAD